MNMMNNKKRSGRISIIAASALLAYSGITQAERVNLDLEYICPIPLLGDTPVTATYSADMPGFVQGGEGLEVNMSLALPESVGRGFRLVNVGSVAGEARAGTELAFSSIVRPLTMSMGITATDIPFDGTGGLEVTASGVLQPYNVGIEEEGTAAILIGDLVLDLVTRYADGSLTPEPLGAFTAACRLDAGQDRHLGSTYFGHGDPGDSQSINLSTEAVEFGRVQAGLTEEAAVRVMNGGVLPLGINGLGVDGPDAGAFQVASDCTVVASGESCTIRVTYFPAGEDTQNATLTIFSDDPDRPAVEVALSGESVLTPIPEIIVEEEVDFGSMATGTISTREIVVSNGGNAAVGIGSATITGEDASSFTVSASDCVVVGPDENCSISVTFVPLVSGTLRSTLTVVANDASNSSVDIALVGTAIESDQPPVVEFPLAVQGSSTLTKAAAALPLAGTLEAGLELATARFTADLKLEDTETTVQLFPLLQKTKTMAEVRFEQVGQTTGTLLGGDMRMESTMYIAVPEVTVRLFGFPVQIGGGSQCRTMEPVLMSLRSPEGELFDMEKGGVVEGEYYLPPLENCGALTGILNHVISGYGNSVELNLIPRY